MGVLSRILARSREGWVLLLLGAAGVGVRAASVFLTGPLHPDEFFQYLEPAYIRLTGVGIEAWEFRDGIRSWVLPFYNGAWLATFMALGVRAGETLLALVQLQWALVNSLVIWAAYRGGASCARRLTGAAPDAPWAGFEGGLCAAFLCASFPLLVIYAGHTLSELPSLLFLLLGLVELAELSESGVEARAVQRKAALSGAYLSLGACLRIANGPLVLVAPLCLLFARRCRACVALLLAASLPALAFGLVDLFTWGTFAHSYVEYIRFNFIEGKAANFGTAPPLYYLELVGKRAPLSAPALLLAACFGLRRNFAFLLPAAFGLAYLSTQEHKEERFMLFFWPLLFVAAGGALGAIASRARAAARAGRPAYAQRWVPLLVLAAPLEGAMHLAELSWLDEARFRAEQVVARDPTLTGLMIDGPIFAGGALYLGGRAPHLDFSKGVLPNPLITHVVVKSDSGQRSQAQAHGFKVLRQVDRFVVLRRLPAQR